ncbi:MAG: hypothetical protein ACM30E_12790 [Nitrososphaerales archaeon]
MEGPLLIAILVLGAVTLSAVSWISHLESLNDRLREQNEALRQLAMNQGNDGIGCGTVLGIVILAAIALFVIAGASGISF